MTQCVTNVFLCKSPLRALHRVHNHILTDDWKGSQERHSPRRHGIQLLVQGNFGCCWNQTCSFWAVTARLRTLTEQGHGRTKLYEWIISDYLWSLLTPVRSTVWLTPRLKTTAEFCPSSRAEIQSRVAVNPTGLTNWLLSPLRGINVSDLTDSDRAMKCYSAHHLNT